MEITKRVHQAHGNFSSQSWIFDVGMSVWYISVSNHFRVQEINYSKRQNFWFPRWLSTNSPRQIDGYRSISLLSSSLPFLLFSSWKLLFTFLSPVPFEILYISFSHCLSPSHFMFITSPNLLLLNISSVYSWSVYMYLCFVFALSPFLSIWFCLTFPLSPSLPLSFSVYL